MLLALLGMQSVSKRFEFRENGGKGRRIEGVVLKMTTVVPAALH